MSSVSSARRIFFPIFAIISVFLRAYDSIHQAGIFKSAKKYYSYTTNMRKFFTKAKIIWTIIILAIGGFVAWRIAAPTSADEGILTDTINRQDLTRTVLATGEKTSETALALSFKISGVATRVNAKVASKPASGQILA